MKFSPRGPRCWVWETSLIAIDRSSSGASGDGDGEIGGGEDCSTLGEIRATALLAGDGMAEGEAATIFGPTGGGVDFRSGRSSAECTGGLAGAMRCQMPRTARKRITARMAAT